MEDHLTYPKIETVFDRDTSFKVRPDSFRRPEFALVKDWLFMEKVNGTNIRLVWNRLPDGQIHYKVIGKTDVSQLPEPLNGLLTERCEVYLPEVQAIMTEHQLDTFVLHGEGYGPKIQSGGRYGPTQDFILFDVYVGGGVWLDENTVSATAQRLGLRRVPFVGAGSISHAIRLVQPPGFTSSVAENYDAAFVAEGIVGKTWRPLYDNRGRRLIWKLKTRDFARGAAN